MKHQKIDGMHHLLGDVQRHLMVISTKKILRQILDSSSLSTHQDLELRAESPQGEWVNMVERMMLTLAESGHPVFRATSPLSRGQPESKGGGKMSIHYCADGEIVETVLCTDISVNQLSFSKQIQTFVKNTKPFVEIGQCFMTKNTAGFSQSTDAVACREYTLPRDEETSEPNGRIRGNTKVGTCWKLQLVACTANMELRS